MCDQPKQASDQMGTRTPPNCESVLCGRQDNNHVDSPFILAESIAKESNSIYHWDTVDKAKTLQAASEQLS